MGVRRTRACGGSLNHCECQVSTTGAGLCPTLAPTGLMESTVAAFAHFTYKWSKNSIVLADMQSSSGNLVSGKPGKIFFDHMTHSNVEGDTGIGDYGEKGIRAFLEQHTCGGICARMRLAALHDEAQSGD
ncbi:hypothetical protein K439DRAFT_1538559, partial [Ramaria rubella]